jgi:hypothetical protein
MGGTAFVTVVDSAALGIPKHDKYRGVSWARLYSTDPISSTPRTLPATRIIKISITPVSNRISTGTILHRCRSYVDFSFKASSLPL